MSDPRVAAALAWLRKRGSQRNIDGMARYGISAPKAFGVSMQSMRPLVRELGRDHALALELWDTGWLEARILASFVDVAADVTSLQMERWARDFDNWAVCDSVCIHLFVRDERGPFVEPHVLHPVVRDGVQVKRELTARPTRGRLACDPKRTVAPTTHRGVTTITPRTDDPRATTCPKCMASPEYAEMMERLGAVPVSTPEVQ